MGLKTCEILQLLDGAQRAEFDLCMALVGMREHLEKSRHIGPRLRSEFPEAEAEFRRRLRRLAQGLDGTGR